MLLLTSHHFSSEQFTASSVEYRPVLHDDGTSTIPIPRLWSHAIPLAGNAVKPSILAHTYITSCY